MKTLVGILAVMVAMLTWHLARLQKYVATCQDSVLLVLRTQNELEARDLQRREGIRKLAELVANNWAQFAEVQFRLAAGIADMEQRERNRMLTPRYHDDAEWPGVIGTVTNMVIQVDRQWTNQNCAVRSELLLDAVGGEPIYVSGAGELFKGWKTVPKNNNMTQGFQTK